MERESSTPARASIEDAVLAQQLARLGVRHLRVYRSAEDAAPIDAETLIAALASHPEPRFREALIALFIRHPELAAIARDAVKTLDSSAALVLQHMYTAAVYLQRFWRGTLGIYLGASQLLPDYFGQSRFELPEPAVDSGEAGLRALAERFQAETGFEWLSEYESVMDLLLEQLRIEAESLEHPATATAA